MMTNTELVSRAIEISRNYETTYIWGGLGRPITEENLARAVKQYPAQNAGFAQIARQYLGNNKAFLFDCVGLIKSILWGWSGDHNASLGGAVYTSNGVPEQSADGMISACPDATEDFSRIIPGEVVWLPGHIGIYIGNGQAVECTPAWGNGVQITNLANVDNTVYPCRTWEKHGRLPWVEYDAEEYDPVQEDIDRLQDWARPTIQKLYDRKSIKGDGQRLGLSLDSIKLLVILDREGIFEKGR